METLMISFSQDEIGSKYTAFSEDAMAEQIAQLTAICNQVSSCCAFAGILL